MRRNNFTESPGNGGSARLEEDEGMREDEPDILDLLVQHEVAMEELYEAFAARFASGQDFWQCLTGDEQRHGDWLGRLRPEPAMDS